MAGRQGGALSIGGSLASPGELAALTPGPLCGVPGLSPSAKLVRAVNAMRPEWCAPKCCRGEPGSAQRLVNPVASLVRGGVLGEGDAVLDLAGRRDPQDVPRGVVRRCPRVP